ncbi:hypothetical protein FFI94_033100 [Rhodococcus sp. KBS0724]|uniref:hypothetical protein n=1 Tax=Rhodococcus sp. KBS0724 TaxID=1179674 RepID=UPI001185311F|nr:hypothetical protein [Rhodococcus sp. KBS0724]TSD40525.1 hypothetical protein FFI94_033100 [Rhodococcus sp. KBS0724]
MNNPSQQAGRSILDGVRESLQQERSAHGDDQRLRGFTSAAGIALRRIQEKIDAFREQMKGSGLTKAEQVIYAQLEELKSEIEADCDGYWRGTGVDWRPRKPIAQGTVRRTGEPQSSN